MRPNDTDVISSQEVALLLGLTRSGVTRLVHRGALAPVMKLPGKTGAYLFDRAAIEEMAAASC